MSSHEVKKDKKSIIILILSVVVLALVIVMFFMLSNKNDNKQANINSSKESSSTEEKENVFSKKVELNSWELEVTEPVYDPEEQTLSFVVFKRKEEDDLFWDPDFTVYLDEKNWGQISNVTDADFVWEDVQAEYGEYGRNDLHGWDGAEYANCGADRITIPDVPKDFKQVTIKVALRDMSAKGAYLPEYIDPTLGDEEAIQKAIEENQREIVIESKDFKIKK